MNTSTSIASAIIFGHLAGICLGMMMMARTRRTLCIALAALLALLAAMGEARADTVGLHLYTIHPAPGVEDSTSAWAGQKKLWNDRTLGAYWRSDDGLTMGVYCNSYSGTERNVGPTGLRADIQQRSCNVTKYVGWTWERPLLGDLRGAITMVAIHGYGLNLRNVAINGANFLVAPVPSVAWGPVRVSFPGTQEVHFSLEHSF